MYHQMPLWNKILSASTELLKNVMKCKVEWGCWIGIIIIIIKLIIISYKGGDDTQFVLLHTHTIPSHTSINTVLSRTASGTSFLFYVSDEVSTGLRNIIGGVDDEACPVGYVWMPHSHVTCLRLQLVGSVLHLPQWCRHLLRAVLKIHTHI